MPIAVSYEIENDKRFKAGIRRAQSQMDDLRGPFQQIADDFYRYLKNTTFSLKGPGRFPDLSTKPFRALWKHSAKNPNVLGKGAWYKGGYKQYKQLNYGFTYPILVRTGRLFKSVTIQGSAENITAIGPKQMILGTTVPYAGTHQFGESPVPMRKFFFIDKPTTGRFLRILEAWVIKSTRSAIQGGK